MKREELRALGMTPEQINKVMNLNGNDVNREKSRAKAGLLRTAPLRMIPGGCSRESDHLFHPEGV